MQTLIQGDVKLIRSLTPRVQRKVCTMRILPQFARLTPTRLPALRFWLKVFFIVGGTILIYHAEQERIVREAQEDAEYQAFIENLHREADEDERRSDEQFASIYRSLNTIFSHAGLN